VFGNGGEPTPSGPISSKAGNLAILPFRRVKLYGAKPAPLSDGADAGLGYIRRNQKSRLGSTGKADTTESDP
jgi:hypothetical protein